MKINTPLASVETTKEDYEVISCFSKTEIPQLISNQLAFWRWRNLIRISKKAIKLCQKNNLNPQKIAPGFLVPFIEDASQEDDETLQDIWAKILAQESNTPGSISKRTLNVLKNVSKDEALTLNDLIIDSFLANDNNYYCYRYDGINLANIIKLSDAGLLTSNTSLYIQPSIPKTQTPV